MTEDFRGWSGQEWPYPNNSTGDVVSVETQEYARFYVSDEELKRNLAQAIPAEDTTIPS